MTSAAGNRTPRARRGVAALVVAGLVVASGCSGEDDADGAGGGEAANQVTTTTTTPKDTTAAPPSSSTSVPPTTTTTTTTTAPVPTTVPFDGSTGRVEIPRPATTQEVVAHTGLATATRAGEERITFTFAGALPAVVVDYVDRPVRESGSGDEVAVEGGAILAVRFEPASSAQIDGDQVSRTYTGPDRVAGPSAGGTVAEVVRTGDFEAVYEWVVGVSTRVPFRVEVSDANDTVSVVVPAA